MLPYPIHNFLEFATNFSSSSPFSRSRHANTHAHTHTRTRTHAYTRTRTRTHTHTHAYKYAHTRINSHAHTHTPACVLLIVTSKFTGPAQPPESAGVIEQHATMEHGRVSRSALRAGPATAARMCGPAGPFYGLGPVWADHETSWAVPPKDVPEDEPDVLY